MPDFSLLPPRDVDVRRVSVPYEAQDFIKPVPDFSLLPPGDVNVGLVSAQASPKQSTGPGPNHSTLTHLRTHSILGIGAGSRDGLPCSLTCVLTCFYSAGNLSLRPSKQTESTSFKGLGWFAICVRMSTTLNGFVAHWYLPYPRNSAHHHCQNASLLYCCATIMI